MTEKQKKKIILPLRERARLEEKGAFCFLRK